MNQNNNKFGVLAFLPIAVVIALSFYAVTIPRDSTIPPLIIFFFAALIAFCINPKQSLDDKLSIFSKGVGNTNITTMVIIFLLAGAFGGISKSLGYPESVVNLFMSYFPTEFMILAIFLVGCLMSFVIGTSNGTIVAVAPIALTFAETCGYPIPLVMGAVLSGAIFGDNLSVISDTTIAATQICKVKMQDKLKANFLLAVPAAIIASIAFYIAGGSIKLGAVEFGDYDLLEIIPYITLFILILLRMNVFVVLLSSIFVAGVLGIVQGQVTFIEVTRLAFDGMMGMATLCILVFIMGGILQLVKYYGGMEYLLKKMLNYANSKKRAEFSIVMLSILCSLATANNTIGIVTAGAPSKQIGDRFGVEPKRIASLLDIASCCTMGIFVPYGGAMLVTAGLADINAVSLIQYGFYPQALAVITLATVFFGFDKSKKEHLENNMST